MGANGESPGFWPGLSLIYISSIAGWGNYYAMRISLIGLELDGLGLDMRFCWVFWGKIFCSSSTPVLRQSGGASSRRMFCGTAVKQDGRSLRAVKASALPLERVAG